MYQAIVFLPLLGAILAGLIALLGARARFPGEAPPPGVEDEGTASHAHHAHAHDHAHDGAHGTHGHDDHGPAAADAIAPPLPAGLVAADDPIRLPGRPQGAGRLAGEDHHAVGAERQEHDHQDRGGGHDVRSR